MYKTYAFTIRPKCGIRDSDISHFIKKFKKSHKNNGYFFYMVTEKEGTERHIHAQIWYDKPTEKGVVSKYLSREFPKLWGKEDYILKIALDVRVVFNHDWIEQYCQKGEHKCWLNLKPEPEVLDSYLPPQEKQEAWIAKKNATDTQLHEMEIKYREMFDHVHICSVAKFLAEAMFGKDKWLRPLRSHKAKVELTNTLYYWLNGVDDECCDSFIDTGDKNLSPGINIDNYTKYNQMKADGYLDKDYKPIYFSELQGVYLPPT